MSSPAAASETARPAPWYLQWWFIIVALIFGSWLGLIPLWLSPLPTKRTKVALTLVLVLLQLLFLCTFFALSGGLSYLGLHTAEPDIPRAPADMSFALVKDVTRDGQLVMLSLEADPEGASKIGRPLGDSKYSAASVRVDQSTKIIDMRSSQGLGTMDDLLSAEHVDVWFAGPVAESNPVQAKAGTVVIGYD